MKAVQLIAIEMMVLVAVLGIGLASVVSVLRTDTAENIKRILDNSPKVIQIKTDKSNVG